MVDISRSELWRVGEEAGAGSARTRWEKSERLPRKKEQVQETKMRACLETGAVACFLGAANPPGRRAAPTAVERVLLRVMHLLGSQNRGGVGKKRMMIHVLD